MNRREITQIAESEFARLTGREEPRTEVQMFRRPVPRDETDRIGREIVRRMMEAGVVESR